MTQLSVTHPSVCAPTPNPRIACARCYRPELCGAAQGPRAGVPSDQDGTTEDPRRPRDIALEKELSQLSALAAGHPNDHGLREFADARAWPGGWRREMDALRETCEEVADASNYLLAEATKVYAAAQAGDPEALDDYEWAMRNHSIAVHFWRNLLTRSS